MLAIASVRPVMGCADEAPAPGDWPTVSSDAAGTTTTLGAAEATAGERTLCTDVLGDNGKLETAYALALDAANGHRVSLAAELCPGERDFLRYEPPCAGYFGVEVVVAQDGDDVTLVLRDEAGVELQRSEGYPQGDVGAFRMEALHRSLVVGTDALVIEVQHVAGVQVPYGIVAYFLPTGSCAPASWACEATGRLVVSTPADAVQYHARPSRAELAEITERCRAACRAWASEPSVVGDCEEPGAFATPSLFHRPG